MTNEPIKQSQMDNLIGNRLARYQIEALLGEGMLGALFRATDLPISRPVALRIVPGSLLHTPALQAKFLQDIRSVARLYHQSIATLYNFDAQGDTYYLITEYVPGLALDIYLERLRERQQVIQLDETLLLLTQAADALAHAHELGIFHGDLNPGNLLIKHLPHAHTANEHPLRLKITDFGLQTLLQSRRGSESQDPSIAASYGKNADLAGDIYALGSIAYEMLCGRPTTAISKQQLTTDAGSTISTEGMSDIRLPEVVIDLLDRSLDLHGQAPFANMEAMSAAIQHARNTVTERPATRFSPYITSISLLLQIPSSAADSPAEESETPITGAEAYLVATQPEAQPVTFRMNKPILTIGRADDNDLTLNALGVSRHHLRLEQIDSGWQVIDLDSTNRTHMSEEPLVPLIPQEWPQDTVLYTGPYQLRWLPGVLVLQSNVAEPDRSVQPLLQWSIEPQAIRITPGEKANLTIRLANSLPTDAQYRLSAQGVPVEWLTFDRSLITLGPAATDTVSLSVHPPRSAASVAGRWPIEIVAARHGDEAESLAIPIQLTLREFVHFAAELEPRQLQGDGKCRIIIRNSGNTTTTFNIKVTESDSRLRLETSPIALRVLPGSTDYATLAVSAKKRPWMDRGRLLHFQVTISSSSARLQSVTGRYLLQPRIHAGFSLILALVCILIGAILWSIYLLLYAR